MLLWRPGAGRKVVIGVGVLFVGALVLATSVVAEGEVAVAAPRVDPRVVAPDLPSGRGLQCDDLSERRADVHHTVNDDRRHLERGLAAHIDDGFSGVVAPHDLQGTDVCARDLCER